MRPGPGDAQVSGAEDGRKSGHIINNGQALTPGPQNTTVMTRLSCSMHRENDFSYVTLTEPLDYRPWVQRIS